MDVNRTLTNTIRREMMEWYQADCITKCALEGHKIPFRNTAQRMDQCILWS